MKDYYQILGVDEEASREEIEARWAELMGQYRSRLHKRESEASEKIKEVKEAYEALTDPSKRKEYDFDRLLKRSIQEVHQRRKHRDDKKRLIIPVSAIVFILVVGFFTFKMAQLIFQQKPVISEAPDPVREAERISRPAKPVPGGIPEVPNQKSSQKTPEQIVESKEAISPVAESPKKELEPKKEITKEPVKIAKPILKEMPKPVSEKRPKVEEPKPVNEERRTAKAYAPVSEEARRSEIEIVKEKEIPKATPKEVPKEVTPALPKEEPKTIQQEPPVPQPSPPTEAEPKEQKSPVPQIPPKPVAPIAAIPPAPEPFVKENEVRQFLVKYVDRYTHKDIEGFLAFFSPMAIQNQKDGIEGIRKIYSKQFELYERFEYHLKDTKIEILEKSVKVRASYEIEQFSKKGETKHLRGEIEWDLVKEDGNLKILAIQYRPHKTR
jgi:curved DNA-binding protein CbpA